MKYRRFETTLLAANLFEPSLVVYINTIPHTLDTFGAISRR